MNAKPVLLDRLMRPAERFMGKLRLSTKLLLVFSLAMLPLAILVVHTVWNALEPVRSARLQLGGTAVIRPLLDAVIETQRQRDLQVMKASGYTEGAAALQAAREGLGRALGAVDARVNEYDALDLKKEWSALRNTLAALSADDSSDARQVFARNADAIEAARRFAALVAEKSSLTLDREAAPYFMTEIAVRRAIPWLETQSQLRALGGGILVRDVADFADRAATQSRLDAIALSEGQVDEALAALQRAGEPLPPEWSAAQEATRAMVKAARASLLGDLVNGKPSEYLAIANTAVDQAAAFQHAILKRLDERLAARKSRLETGFAILAAAVLVLAVLLNALMFAFYISLTHSMRDMHATVARTAGGDLTATLKVEGSDELAETASTIDGMTANLSSLVANIRSNAAMVAQAAETLLTGTSELAERTDQQGSSLQQTTVSVRDMAETVDKNAQSAQAADQLATNLRRIGETSGDAMQAAVKSMEGIQASASRVQEMVTLIDGIAFQTNILALNAAVEAARAGEAGRGFAVVASEVRNLAQRSATAAKEIRVLIDDSAHQVRDGVQQIGEVNRRMAEIVAGIREVAGNLNHISGATVEQSAGLAQITSALQHLDEITTSNGEMAEKTRQAAQNMEQRAIALTRAVASFRLRQGTAEEALALVERAVKLFRQRGRSALATFTNNEGGQYADRDMYVFAFDSHGQYQAAAGLPARVGVFLKDLPGLDGAKLVHDAFAVDGAGWVDYEIVNPVSKNIEHKTSYVVQVEPGLVIGCGVYKIV